MFDKSASISPLPAEYRRAQTAMAVIGMTSLIATSTLWLHITYKLWFGKPRAPYTPRHKSTSSKTDNLATHATAGTVTTTTTNENMDLSLGLSEDHYRYAKGGRTTPQNMITSTTSLADQVVGDVEEQARQRQQEQQPKQAPPNPLLILIYNLLFADISLAATYTVNLTWLREDAIHVGTAPCRAQGWIVSFGCLATSGFLFTISIYTYLAIVRGYKPSSRTVMVHVAALWALIVIMACIGPWIEMNDVNPYFARQGLWCWISEHHVLWRLSIYIWGFACFGATGVLYGLTFRALYRDGRSSRFMPHGNKLPSGHHPAFLVYPFLYLFCATPLTIGSIIEPLEASTTFMAFTGTMLAASGLLDAILWSSTIVFSDSRDMVNTGLDQFAFIRTPEDRSLGNMIWVQGAAYEQRRLSSRNWNGWWQLRGTASERPGSSSSRRPLSNAGRHRGIFENGRGIKLDVVTTVVIEEDDRQGTRI